MKDSISQKASPLFGAFHQQPLWHNRAAIVVFPQPARALPRMVSLFFGSCEASKADWQHSYGEQLIEQATLYNYDDHDDRLQIWW